MVSKFNPFTPVTGHVPPLLAGRAKETNLLTASLDLLAGHRTANGNRLANPPFSPIKIVGPPGAGKTALLSWLKTQADIRRIPVVHCTQPEQADAKDKPMQCLLARMFAAMSPLGRASARLFGAAGIDAAAEQPLLAYESMAKALVAKRPLLVVLDEAQRFDSAHLAMVIQASQELITDGQPLALVLAGTPGLDSRLADSEAAFIVLDKEMHISTLNEAAARESLRDPFEREGISVSAAALDAMTKLTDCYPFFIRVTGEALWDAATAAGRRDIDAGLVRQMEEKAKHGRMSIYGKVHRQMQTSNMEPHARQVLGLLEENGGRMSVNHLIDSLTAAVPAMDDVQAQQTCRDLQEDGFIWNVDGETRPGIPSFFGYFKERQPHK